MVVENIASSWNFEKGAFLAFNSLRWCFELELSLKCIIKIVLHCIIRIRIVPVVWNVLFEHPIPDLVSPLLLQYPPLSSGKTFHKTLGCGCWDLPIDKSISEEAWGTVRVPVQSKGVELRLGLMLEQVGASVTVKGNLDVTAYKDILYNYMPSILLVTVCDGLVST